MSADCVCVLTAVYSFDRVLTVFDLVDGESGMIIVFRKANFHGSEIDFLRGKRIVAGVWGIGKGGVFLCLNCGGCPVEKDERFVHGIISLHILRLWLKP